VCSPKYFLRSSTCDLKNRIQHLTPMYIRTNRRCVTQKLFHSHPPSSLWITVFIYYCSTVSNVPQTRHGHNLHGLHHSSISSSPQSSVAWHTTSDSLAPTKSWYSLRHLTELKMGNSRRLNIANIGAQIRDTSAQKMG